MEKDNNKNKRVIVIVISILLIIILVLGLTFAYLRTELSGSEQIVKVGTLDLILDETSEGISLDNAIGLSDNKGMSITPSTFELKNNGSKAVDYIIYLDDNTIEETDTRIDDKYLKYNLNKNGEDSGATLLTSIGSNPNRVLDMGTIEGKSTNKYSLNLWITDEVDGNYSGHVFSGKLRVEVSQEKAKLAEVLLADNSNNINTTDPEQTFITGENPNNYIWYSGKLWRAVSIDPSDNSVKLVTQWDISTIPYNDNNDVSFEGSNIEMWLNDTSVDGFLGNLRSPEMFIKMDNEWNASMGGSSKPPSKEEGGTIVEDPVGLLNSYEYAMSYSGVSRENGYLNNGLIWWSLTPYTIDMLIGVDSNGTTYGDKAEASRGIRPSIVLKPNISIVSGDGTEESPYRLYGDYDIKLNGTALNTRYSGEYIRFGNDENNLYRIVSHETDGLTKIVSAEPLKDSGTFKIMNFGENSTFSSTSTIGAFLNGEYLTNYVGSEYSNMIADSTTWYLGIVPNAQNYRLSKYTDIDMTNTTTSTEAKVGLLRLGELMSGQFEIESNNFSYWTLTRFNEKDNIWSTHTKCYGYNPTYIAVASVKPALNLKSNIIITSGDGTKENPFELS